MWTLRMKSKNKSVSGVGTSVSEPSGIEVLALLKIDPRNPNRLISRESSKLEYKENYNWNNRAKYAKTLAAFANNDGGFIVFGVKDSPREIIGLTSDQFESQDPSQVTEYLNSKFAPELYWDWYPIELRDFRLGVISVEQAVKKPVLCIASDRDELREADIYYRYRGRSERIRHGELQQLMAENRRQERESFMEHLRKIVRIGPENIGVLDLVSGELSGYKKNLLISDDLVKKVQFIREGRFKTSDEPGLPTLRVIGETKVIAADSLLPVTTVFTPKAIGSKDLMLGFLDQENPQAPGEYIKQACRENSPYMPIYHFARLEGMSLSHLGSMVRMETPNRKPLLKRIEGALVRPFGSLSGETESTKRRLEILEILKGDGDVQRILEYSHVTLCEAISHYRPDTPPQELLQVLAKLVKNEFDTMISTSRTAFRKAIAHLDEVLNREYCGQKPDLQTD